MLKQWLQAMKLGEQLLPTMTLAQRWRYWLLWLEGKPYVGGGETPQGVDCSGTICWALWNLGYDIRVTADRLYQGIFTVPVTEGWENLNRVLAVFYIRDGIASHVTPVVGRYVVLDAWSAEHPVTLKAAAGVRIWYEQHGYTVEWREIDWAAVAAISESGTEAWDVDPLLLMERELIKEVEA